MIYCRTAQGVEFLVSHEDGDLVAAYRWHAAPYRGGARIARRTRKSEGEKSRVVLLYRAIAERMGFPDGLLVDHKNRDTLDNTRGNLRPATDGQNHANAKKYKGHFGVAATSKFRGVSWDRERAKWAACGRLNRKTFHLGRFASEEDAARAYDAWAVKAFGEFANPNFPQDGGRS